MENNITHKGNLDIPNVNNKIQHPLASGELLIGSNVHQATADMVNHPAHYGGKDNPMEVIKIIDHYNLGFALGNTLKYTLRSDKKSNKLEDLKKAAWYLQHEITKLENV